MFAHRQVRELIKLRKDQKIGVIFSENSSIIRAPNVTICLFWL